MTAVSTGRGGARLRLEPASPLRFSWTMVGVIGGALVSVAGAISGYATLTDRVTHLEAQIPPGAIQRLDERTLQIQDALKRLEAR